MKTSTLIIKNDDQSQVSTNQQNRLLGRMDIFLLGIIIIKFGLLVASTPRMEAHCASHDRMAEERMGYDHMKKRSKRT